MQGNESAHRLLEITIEITGDYYRDYGEITGNYYREITERLLEITIERLLQRLLEITERLLE